MGRCHWAVLLSLLAVTALAAGQDADDDAAVEPGPHMPTHAFVHNLQKEAFERHVAAKAALTAATPDPPLAEDARELLVTANVAASTASGPAEIRITASFDATVTALSATQAALVQSTVATAILVLRKFYQVNTPLTSPLVVSPASNCPTGCTGSNCPSGSSYAVPAQLKNGTGQPLTDLYIVVRAGLTDQCTNTVAWAFSCFFDLTTNRPLMGFVNVCPYFFQDAQFSPPLLTRVATVVHEITHALGFTSDFFFPVAGEYVAAADVYGDTVHYITSPRVLATTRAFFNCPSVIGAQLEDQGGSGSADSHWDYRLYNGELMAPSGGYLLSNFTLGVMADLGWYSPRYFFAAPFVRGAGTGCALPTSTCAAIMAGSTSQQFYCGSSGYGTCADTWDKAECSGSNFVFNKPLSCQISVNYGSSSNDDCRSTTSPYYFDYVSAASMCLPTVVKSTTVGGCFGTTCSSAGALSLVAHPSSGAAISVACPTGSSVDLSQSASSVYTSSTVVMCPNNTATCGTLACTPACNTANGQCVAGNCVCYLEWLGVDCNLHVSRVVGTFDSYTPTLPPYPPPSLNSPPYVTPPPPPYAALDPTQPQTQLTVQAKLNMNYTALLPTQAATTAEGNVTFAAPPPSEGRVRVLVLASTSSTNLVTFQSDFVNAVASLLKIPIASVTITSTSGDNTAAVIVFTVLPSAVSAADANLAIAPLTSSPYSALGTAFILKYGITGASVVVLSSETVTLMPSPPPAPGSVVAAFPLGLVIGVAVGVVVLTGLFIGFLIWCCRCRNRQVAPEQKVEMIAVAPTYMPHFPVGPPAPGYYAPQQHPNFPPQVTNANFVTTSMPMYNNSAHPQHAGGVAFPKTGSLTSPRAAAWTDPGGAVMHSSQPPQSGYASPPNGGGGRRGPSASNSAQHLPTPTFMPSPSGGRRGSASVSGQMPTPGYVASPSGRTGSASYAPPLGSLGQHQQHPQHVPGQFPSSAWGA